MPPKLSFSAHLSDRASVSKRGICSIYRSFFTQPEVTLQDKYKVFQAAVRSILTYAAQVWGQNKYLAAEQLQVYFVKLVLKLPRNSPNYILHLEANLEPIFIYTLTQHYKYLLKVLSTMSATRLPQIVAKEDEFRGHCLLFSKGEWLEKDGQFSVNWSSQAYCNYTIFVGVVLALVSAIQIYRMARYIVQGTDSNFLSAFVDVVGCLCLCGMSVVAAVMITFGFIVWCNNMTMRFPSCDMASGQDIDKQDGIDTSNFYIELGTAQFGAWASMACWVGLSVFALLKMCQQHQIRNMRARTFQLLVFIMVKPMSFNIYFKELRYV
ncbi:hypothetical protein GE061_001002 [Apolygus lucorum]|uniref:Uncharacterized protein n=1 Tax=Apolygus lucorum TaxID=248454 RepID=A0A8S9Y8U7_APOLU|nr:hypothetical protein GE061_001002 [Apolygus lucorum]